MKKRKRGFAIMRPDYQREIAILGGKTVAKKYGREHMARIGAIGGTHSHAGPTKH